MTAGWIVAVILYGLGAWLSWDVLTSDRLVTTHCTRRHLVLCALTWPLSGPAAIWAGRGKPRRIVDTVDPTPAEVP
jgi:hypothetical protein